MYRKSFLIRLTRPFSEVQGIPREEARIAVTLDDKDAIGHAVLAHMMMWGSEWEAAIAEARIGMALNPNNAFVISMLGCVLGFGGYRDEALDRLQQAMRASPHDPLTWLWTMWTGAVQFFARRSEAALETYRRLNRLRPEHGPTQGYIAATLASLGRLDEARAVLARARPGGPAVSRKAALAAAGGLCDPRRSPALGSRRDGMTTTRRAPCSTAPVTRVRSRMR
jgi:adenylate cyclase